MVDSEAYLDTFKIQTKDLFKKSENQSTENLKDHEKIYQVKDDLAIVLYTSGSTGLPKGKWKTIKKKQKFIIVFLN